MAGGIYTFLESMRKQGKLTDTRIDNVSKKGHISNDEANELKKIRNVGRKGY